MAYFPYSIMPLTVKQTPPGANPSIDRLRITSQQYNTHDEEIQAIEGFIGSVDKTTGKVKSGMFLDVYNLIDQINMICVEGILCSSGAVQSGQMMTFPENATLTYLTGTLAPKATTISVNSTSGFPEKGVVSIINDVVQGKTNANGVWGPTIKAGTSIVEWIRYEGKTSTSFLNCQRGYLGTTAATHSGVIQNSATPKAGSLNVQDRCLEFDGFNHEICQFRNQSLRNAYVYTCPVLGLVGSIAYIEDYIRLQPDAIRLLAGTTTISLFIAVSNTIGVLGTRSDGTLYLVSKDANYRFLNQLSPSEAYGWTNEAYNKGLVQLRTSPKEITWPDGSVPVFSGKLSVQFSIGALNGSEDYDANPAYPFLAAVSSLGADGTLYSSIDDNKSQYQGASLENILYYQTILIPNVRTFDERNS